MRDVPAFDQDALLATIGRHKAGALTYGERYVERYRTVEITPS